MWYVKGEGSGMEYLGSNEAPKGLNKVRSTFAGVVRWSVWISMLIPFGGLVFACVVSMVGT